VCDAPAIGDHGPAASAADRVRPGPGAARCAPALLPNLGVWRSLCRRRRRHGKAKSQSSQRRRHRQELGQARSTSSAHQPVSSHAFPIACWSTILAQASIRRWLAMICPPSRFRDYWIGVKSGISRAWRIVANSTQRGVDPADARSDHMIAVRRRDEMREANVCLEGQPGIASAIQSWIAGPWAAWATEPRRRTIAIYQQLYKIFQMVDSGVADSPIEMIWGIGAVRWQKEGRVVDRPLLEIRVDLELDEACGGLIRVRPTCVDPTFDLDRTNAWDVSSYRNVLISFAVSYKKLSTTRACHHSFARASSRCFQRRCHISALLGNTQPRPQRPMAPRARTSPLPTNGSCSPDPDPNVLCFRTSSACGGRC
jgi:hypothetical protein